jgi:hypothetical protein
VFKEMRRLDSLDHAKDSAYLIQKGYIRIIKDTLEMEDDPDLEKTEAEKQKDKLTNGNQKRKDSVSLIRKTEAILPDNKKKPERPDSINNQ